jgi:hypothetical protein
VPPPLKPGDHYALGRLATDLLPWLIGGRKAGRQWFVLIAGFYAYTGDFAAALAGLGIGSQVVAMTQGKLPSGQSAVDVLHSAVPAHWLVVGIVAMVAWVILRLVVQREDLVARALLARECARGMNSLYTELFQGLAADDPMPQIAKVQKSVDDRVLDAIKNKVWPFEPPPPPIAAIEHELNEAVDRIRSTYMNRWRPPPAGGI